MRSWRWYGVAVLGQGGRPGGSGGGGDDNEWLGGGVCPGRAHSSNDKRMHEAEDDDKAAMADCTSIKWRQAQRLLAKAGRLC